MNSLFKLYIKRTVLLLFIGILFSLLFIYLSYNGYAKQYDIDTWNISNMLLDYTSSCFTLNVTLELIIIYTFYMYRNKKTGIFLRQLPVKSNKDFITKVLLSLILIILLAAVELILFNIFTKGLISEYYNNIKAVYDAQNTVIQTLESLYTTYYSNFLMLSMLTIFISSITILASGSMGIMGFAIAVPFILYFSFIGFLVGTTTFIRDMDITLDHSILTYFNYIALRLQRLVFEDHTHINYYITLTLLSALMYIISYFCNKHINYSKMGQLFLFRQIKILAYIIGCIFGSFSFYFIGSTIIQPQNHLTVVLILLICFIISYTAIRKIEQIFM